MKIHAMSKGNEWEFNGFYTRTGKDDSMAEDVS